MSARAAFAGAALALLIGCGSAPRPPSSLPSQVAPAPAPASAADPFALPDGPRDDLSTPPPSALRLDAWDAAIQARGVAPPPAMCAAYATRAAASPAPTDLAAALGVADTARDGMLVALEPALDARAPGLLRALRADLAPGACADVLVDPYLRAHRGLVSRAAPVLVGLSLAAKLDRTGGGMPSMGPARDKEKVKAFITGPLRAWILEQSAAIEALASGAAGLSGYGRGVAALAAGNADLRLVDAIRRAPTPPGWDPELKAIYEAALDEALEPRKTRGRDAALVGLSDLAQTGALDDPRVRAAHGLLTSLYGGRRIGALAELMTPRASLAARAPAPASRARDVPPYWADELELGEVDAAHLEVAGARGPSRATRAFFAKAAPGAIAPELRTAYALLRLRMGVTYWRRVDFVEAAYAAAGGGTPEDRLVLALCLSLARGPNGAAAMMRAPSRAALALDHTEALDALAAEGGPLAGWAAFDAAHLRALCPPDGADAGTYLRDVAARFRAAESLLKDAEEKKRARGRAEEIDAILAHAVP
jgi:hypothetical protein